MSEKKLELYIQNGNSCTFVNSTPKAYKTVCVNENPTGDVYVNSLSWIQSSLTLKLHRTDEAVLSIPLTHNHNLNDLTEKSYNSLTDKPTIPGALEDLSNVTGGTDLQVLQKVSGTWQGITLHAVASSGDYNALSNKPTIPSDLEDLDNVDSGATNGQVLGFNGTTWAGVSVATTLVGLSDTTITTPSDNQVIAYDSVSSKYTNQTLADVAWSGSYNDLSDKPTIGTGTVSGSTGYIAKFTNGSTVGDSLIQEVSSELYFGGAMRIQPSANTLEVRIGQIGDSINYPNTHIVAQARLLEIGHNIYNGYVNQPGSKVRVAGGAISLMATTNAANAFSTIAYFDNTQINLDQNTTIGADLTVTGKIILKSQIIDAANSALQLKSTAGFQTVEPGGAAVGSASGKWKLGKHFTDGGGTNAIHASNYLEVDVDGTKYKLAILGTSGGSGGTPSPTYNVTISSVYTFGLSGSVYYAITSNTTKPNVGDFNFLFTITSNSTPSQVLPVEQNEYLWIYHTGSGQSDQVQDPTGYTDNAASGQGHANAKYHLIDQDGSIVVTLDDTAN